jgi:sugar phosphate isomerase/epimerase
MKLGIFAKTFAGTSPRDVLRAARRAGYRAVQYNFACSGLGALPAAVPEQAADAVREAATSEGVEIAAVSATYNMVHPDRAERRRGRQSFAAIAGAAGRMGARLLTVCTGSRDPRDQWRHHPDNASPSSFRELCLECGLLLQVAEDHDLLIGIEPELANVVDTPRRALELLDALGSPRLRIVLDPANLFEVAAPERRRALVEGAIDLLGDRIALAHAKDRGPDGGFATAGRGVIDFRHFFRTLRRAGYDGTVVAHGLGPEEAAEVALFLEAAWTAAEQGE